MNVRQLIAKLSEYDGDATVEIMRPSGPCELEDKMVLFWTDNVDSVLTLDWAEW